MRCFFPALFLSLSLATAAQAGAWLQPQGHGQVIAQGTYFTSDKYYDYRGHATNQPRYNKYEFMPYAEYGLTKTVTIGGTASLQYDTQSSRDNYGLADPEIFARTSLYRDEKQVVSIQPLVKFKSAFDHKGSPRGGSDSTDVELSLLYGRNLNLISNRDYLDLDAGYRYRSTDLHDQYHANAALGLQVAPRVQLIPAIRTTIAAKRLRNVAFSQNGNQDYDLLKLEMTGRYSLTETQAVGLTVFNHVDGRQTGNGTGVTLSFAQQF